MAYTIHKSDGTVVTVADNAIDDAFYNPTGGSVGGITPGLGQGTQLVGRNTIDYGAAIAQNFLQITENFSSATGSQPLGTYALQGQLWYDKTLSNLYVRTTPGTLGADSMANWKKIPVINPTAPGDGDVQVVGSVISIWANGGWQQVFPAIYS
jgi:hypothetical protein